MQDDGTSYFYAVCLVFAIFVVVLITAFLTL